MPLNGYCRMNSGKMILQPVIVGLWNVISDILRSNLYDSGAKSFQAGRKMVYCLYKEKL